MESVGIRRERRLLANMFIGQCLVELLALFQSSLSQTQQEHRVVLSTYFPVGPADLLSFVIQELLELPDLLFQALFRALQQEAVLRRSSLSSLEKRL